MSWLCIIKYQNTHNLGSTLWEYFSLILSRKFLYLCFHQLLNLSSSYRVWNVKIKWVIQENIHTPSMEGLSLWTKCTRTTSQVRVRVQLLFFFLFTFVSFLSCDIFDCDSCFHNDVLTVVWSILKTWTRYFPCQRDHSSSVVASKLTLACYL